MSVYVCEKCGDSVDSDTDGYHLLHGDREVCEACMEFDASLYLDGMRELAAEEKAEADFDDAISEGRFNE